MTQGSRRGRVVGAALAVAVMLAVGSIALPDAHADDADAALDRARTATVSEDFSGIVQIEWLQDGDWQVARVPVNGTGGTVQVGAGTHKAEASDDDRWIAGVSGWQAGRRAGTGRWRWSRARWWPGAPRTSWSPPIRRRVSRGSRCTSTVTPA
jgi:hypothetical protein